MPSYSYLARDEQGKAVTGTMVAPTQEALADELKRMGYLVTRTRELREDRVGFESLLQHVQRVSFDELVLFNIQLSKMIQVGIPLLTALKVLEAQTANRRLRGAIGDVARNVEAGLSFSEALTRHPRIFSPLFVSMIEAGETSGKLDEILSRLAQFAQHQAELRQQLTTALTYPCLLFIVGVGIVVFLVTGIIPKFMKIFLEAGVPLPLPTLLLHRLSEVVRHHGVWMLLVVVGVGVALSQSLRTPQGRRHWDAWLLRLPVIGSLVRHVALSRFARTFETLTSSGVPILESLAIVEQTTGNAVLGDVVRSVQTSVRQGGSLAEPLKVSQEFPPMAVQMISVGESSGTLDHMLGQLADHYDLLVRHGIKRATAFVEPLFLAIMGGGVAFIMASMLLPLFRMVSVIR